jgi:hypothetical protein
MITLRGAEELGATKVDGSVGLYVGCWFEDGAQSVQIYAEDAIVVSGRFKRHVPRSVDALFGQSRLLRVNDATQSSPHT